MTQRDRENIVKLRMAGLGYKAIASRIGLSRDSVKSYCKYHGIDGNAEAAKLNYQKRIDSSIVCPVCGYEIKQISGRGRKKRFCSDKCRTAWWSKNYVMHNFSADAIHKYVCAGCGHEFTAYGNKSRKYCSHECYIKHRFGGQAND